MGITVGPITTPQGFQLESIYIRMSTVRILSIAQNESTYHCIFTYEGYKSHQDKLNGCSALSIPEGLRQAETIIPSLDFLRQDIFEIAYRTLKGNLGEYTVQDTFEPNQLKGSDYRFNRDGYDVDGFNADGYDKDGYGKDGFNAQGYDREGYDREGYDAQGFNRNGYDKDGYDKDGYDMYGYDRNGLDVHGNPRPTAPLYPPT